MIQSLTFGIFNEAGRLPNRKLTSTKRSGRLVVRVLAILAFKSLPIPRRISTSSCLDSQMGKMPTAKVVQISQTKPIQMYAARPVESQTLRKRGRQG